MKNILFCLLLFYFSGASGQKFIVPYSEEGLYGLMNEKGKVLVKPVFEEVNWLTDRYFKASKSFHSTDTVEMSPGHFYIQNDRIGSNSLLYGESFILKDEPFSHFDVLPGKCIIGRYNRSKYSLSQAQLRKYGAHGKFYSLFNLKGKNVYPENFLKLNKVDTTGVHPNQAGRSRYVLFAAETLSGKGGFFVYDALTQTISEWLLEGIRRIKTMKVHENVKTVTLTAVNSDGVEARYMIRGDKNKFQLEKLPERSRREKEGKGVAEGSVEEVETISISDVHDVAVPVEVAEKPDPVLRKRFQPFLTGINDSLFYVANVDDKRFLLLPAGAEKIFLHQTKKPVQGIPVIIKMGKKFFLADSSGIQTAAYDSMLYFGPNYLVGKRSGSKLLFGTIDRYGKELIPVKYDSITGGPATIQARYNNNNNDSGSIHLTSFRYESNDYGRNRPERSPYALQVSGSFLLYSNGLCGLSNGAHQFILPLQYEFIAVNKTDFMIPKRSEFLIVKKDGNFGVAIRSYNTASGKEEVKMEVAPSLPFIPLFKYNDYYGINGLTLYGLFDEKLRLRAFAQQNGTIIPGMTQAEK